MIYLSISIVICVILWLVYQYKFNIYVDSMETQTNLSRVKDNTRFGYSILYKRTYKNGKVKYFEKTYKLVTP